MPFRFGHDAEISAFVTGGAPTRQEAARALARARAVMADRLDPAGMEAAWTDLGLSRGGNPLTVQARLRDLFAPPPVPFVRSFYQHSRSHYRDAAPLGDGVTENIMVGVTGTGEDGIAVSGEFAIEWVDVGGEASARIVTFHDGLAAMNCCGDLLYALEQACGGRRSSPTPDEVSAILQGLGYGDSTSVSPDGDPGTDVSAEARPPGP